MLEMPFVAGAGGGVGTSVVASALGAADAGLYRAGQPVHVLVCRLTMASIGDAQRAIAAAPFPPVLAVVGDIPRAGLTGGMRGRLRMTEPLVPATVMVPYVTGWRDLADPWSAAAAWQQDPRPPRPMRAFVGAIQQLAAAVTPLLRPLTSPTVAPMAPSAAAPQEFTPLRPAGVATGPAGAGDGRPVASPAVAALIAARGVTGSASAATARGGRPAMPSPVSRPGAPAPVHPVVGNPTRGR
jgi:hypothetical protein